MKAQDIKTQNLPKNDQKIVSDLLNQTVETFRGIDEDLLIQSALFRLNIGQISIVSTPGELYTGALFAYTAKKGFVKVPTLRLLRLWPRITHGSELFKAWSDFHYFYTKLNKNLLPESLFKDYGYRFTKKLMEKLYGSFFLLYTIDALESLSLDRDFREQMIELEQLAEVQRSNYNGFVKNSKAYHTQKRQEAFLYDFIQDKATGLDKLSQILQLAMRRISNNKLWAKKPAMVLAESTKGDFVRAIQVEYEKRYRNTVREVFRRIKEVKSLTSTRTKVRFIYDLHALCMPEFFPSNDQIEAEIRKSIESGTGEIFDANRISNYKDAKFSWLRKK